MNLLEAQSEADSLRAPYSAIDDAPPIVYHYTSIPAFLAISQTKSIWCSNIAYSNDPDESRYAHDVISQVVRQRLTPRLAELVEKMMPKFSYYGASFSNEADLLQQWRAYCGNGQGVALGVKSEMLRMHPHFMFGRVEYSVAEQQRLIARMVDLFGPFLENVADGSRGIAELAGSLGMNLAILNGMFKSPAYAVEQEYRLFKLSTAEIDVGDAAVLFRATSRAIVPYRVMQMNDSHSTIRDRPFAEIVVGPCLEYDIVAPGTRALLQRMKLVDVSVRASTVRMRA